MGAKDYSSLVLPFAGRYLAQFCVGSGVRLDFTGPPHYEITIESPLSVEALNIDRADPTSTAVLAALRDQLMKPVVSVAEVSGELTIAFGDLTITVPRDNDYEAWQIRADDGLMIVCIPGGELAGFRSSAELPFGASPRSLR